MKSNNRWIKVTVEGLVGLTILVSLVAAADGPANPKIAPRLVSDTANGASAEALVVLTEQADLTAADRLQTKLEKGTYVFQTLQAVAHRTQGPLQNFLDQRGIPYQSFYIVNMLKVKATRALLDELATRDDVAEIDANPQVQTALPSPQGNQLDQSGHGPEWNVERVHAPEVWNLGFRGRGMVVAGADTGVKWDHPALKVQYRGWNGHTVNHNYNWHDATSEHSPVPVDPHGHGTFTASEMVGDDGHGNQVGVAPGAEWIACRNMDLHGVGSPSQYIECFEFFLAPYPIGRPNLGNPALAPDSINNSWACPPSEGCSVNTLLQIVNRVRAAGIFSVMAAGNSGPDCSTVSDPPAIYQAAVSVGAIDSYQTIASFSSRGPVTIDHSGRLKPDLVAPGVNIRAAIPYNNGYQGYWSGTSMASPHVAGGVALLWQAIPLLKGRIDSTELILKNSALPLESNQHCGGPHQLYPNDTYGYGLLNLLRAIQTH